jgi:diacylglycerol kinase family enzyme
MRPAASSRRYAAIVALGAAAAVLVLGALDVFEEFPRGLVVVGLVGVAGLAGWYALLRRGIARVLGALVAGLALVGAVALVLLGGHLLLPALIAMAIAVAVVAGRAAFAPSVVLAPAPRPVRPALLFNPKSGGGKAERYALAREARARGIEPVELAAGDDLEQLARDAVARGADALAMAGGDGSQAIVAAVASELGLPYACVPAGTRNHFALDLGVDRDDVVGALDAFVDGGERVVDLGDVNGRVFVNNVSLGLYAEAVRRPGYREAKLRTLLDTVPVVLGDQATPLDLRWTGPSGQEHGSGAAILVSNNRYRLGRVVGSGTRPRIDDGLLGITVVSGPIGGRHTRRLQRPWRAWPAQMFEVCSDRPVAAGIDGEAVTLEAPLRFRIRPTALRVRIARSHPGASPSALLPDGMWDSLRAVARIATDRSDPATLDAPPSTTTTPEEST